MCIRDRDNGSRFNAYTKLAIMPTPSTPRSRCKGQRTRSSGRQPCVHNAHVSTNGNEANPRNAAT